jgi:hypothetical protein
LVTPDQQVQPFFASGTDFQSIKEYPNLNFIVVINPNSGPGGCPVLPDEQYCAAIPYLRGFNNVTLLGYVRTSYGKRMIRETVGDIDTYWRWHEVSSSPSAATCSRTIGVDGIFIDEVEYSGLHLKYFEQLYRNIKDRRWSSGKPGLNPLYSPAEYQDMSH